MFGRKKYQGQHFTPEAPKERVWIADVTIIVLFAAMLVGAMWWQRHLTPEINVLHCNETVQTLMYDGKTAVCQNAYNVPAYISAVEISEADYQDLRAPKLSGDQRLNVKMDPQDSRQTGLNMIARCESYGGNTVDDVCYVVDK